MTTDGIIENLRRACDDSENTTDQRLARVTTQAEQVRVLTSELGMLLAVVRGIAAGLEGVELAELEAWAAHSQVEGERLALAITALSDASGDRDYFSGCTTEAEADQTRPEGIVRPWPIVSATTLAETVVLYGSDAAATFQGRCVACGDLATCVEYGGDPVCHDCMPVWSGAQS